MSLLLWAALAPYCLVVIACAVLFRRAARRGRGACGKGGGPLTVVVCTADRDAAMCAVNMRSVAISLREGDSLIVVADHVSAASLSLLRKSAEEVGGRAIVIENSGPRGKKNAQRCGVSAACGGTVVAVDADCRVGVRFADCVRSAVGGLGGLPLMLLLPVEMCGGGSFFGRLVELEFGCLQVVTAGSAMAGRPTMANGAGMAFSKALYDGHDAMTAYASGDDMFLLAHALRVGAAVRYLPEADAVVSSVAPDGVGAYLRQRTRWLAKAGGYRSPGVIVLALVVFVAVVAWPVAALLWLMGLSSGWLAVWLFAAKLVADAAVCASWLAFRGGSGRLRAMLWLCVPLEAVYPLMTVVVALRAVVADKKRW